MKTESTEYDYITMIMKHVMHIYVVVFSEEHRCQTMRELYQ